MPLINSSIMKLLLILPIFLFLHFSNFAQPMIIAHRGASFVAPENTVASAKLAWQLDADAVELDIHLSKDNRVIVIHDNDTKRTTGELYKVSETNSEVLRRLDAGLWKNVDYKGEKLPFLEEMIATIPEGNLMVIEIKCGKEVLPVLKTIAEASGKKQQLVFIGFGWEIILATKQLFPANKCYWLSDFTQDVKIKLNDPKIQTLDGINLYSKIIDQDIFDLATKKGLEVLAWTVDDPKEAHRLAKIGVIGITTNKPDLIRNSLK
jgi:glycerophosphoryl diester phosphodiesterase